MPGDMANQQENELTSLKSDIERLNDELKTATLEKIQSAQYGLVLLVSTLACDQHVSFNIFN